MGRVRYLGSKARIVNAIIENIGLPKKGQRLIDLFCGTGVVGVNAAHIGWQLLANDILSSATTLTSARLVSASDVPFTNFSGYSNAIELLNQAAPLRGYFYREYSPSCQNDLSVSRPYFSEENAMKIDGIRLTIKNWKKEERISLLEERLLIADLIEASNGVANIAGTYGCFIKELTRPALRPIRLIPRTLSKKLSWNVTSKDALEIEDQESDVLYLDPPYTKRQYAAYYHIPETLAAGDEPKVDGKTGLRPWRTKSSLFCYKTKARETLSKLIRNSKSHRILISYSSDGHITYNDMVAELKALGNMKIIEFNDFEPYTPNKKSRENAQKKRLTEYLFELRR